MFNQQARWDRKLPQASGNNSQLLKEKISVLCLFAKGKVLPRYFFWKNHTFRIEKVLFYWQEQQGREIISYFSLKTNEGLYQISFSNITFSWRLDKIIDT